MHALVNSIDGSKKGARDARLSGPNSFIYMQFSAKIYSNNRFLPQTHGLAPALGHPRSATEFTTLQVINALKETFRDKRSVF